MVGRNQFLCAIAVIAFGLSGTRGLEGADTIAPNARLAAKGMLLDIALAGNRLVAVGDHGIVVFSDNEGETWTQALVETESMLTSVAFADESTGWSAGHGGLILGTKNGGKTWHLLDSPASEHDSFLDVLVVGPDHIVAVGAYGLFCESKDGGASWEIRYVLEEDMHINRLTRASDGRILLAGESGTLAVSEDSAKTWDALDSPYDGSLYGLWELADGAWLTHGLRGHAFRSDDQGASWKQIEIDHEVLIMSQAELSRNRVVMGGLGGWLFVSHDGGKTFISRHTEALASTAEFLVLPSGQVALVGHGGVAIIDVP